MGDKRKEVGLFCLTGYQLNEAGFGSKKNKIMAKIKFTYEAPRWVKTSGFVKQLSLWCNIECKIAVTKGWLMESGTVICEGTDANIIKFSDELKAAMHEYNCN